MSSQDDATVATGEACEEGIDTREAEEDTQASSNIGEAGWRVFQIPAKSKASPDEDVQQEREFARDLRQKLNEFYFNNRPSKLTESEVSWISIEHDEEDVKQSEEETNEEALVAEWESLSLEDKATTAEQLHLLARKHNVLSGKWMIFCSTSHVDRTWREIAYGMLNDDFGPCAKVSPVSSRGAKNQHVICVYAADYTNQEDVQRIKQSLIMCGQHKNKLIFKPDVYTYCGIYHGNKWRIPVGIYSE